MTTRYWWKNGNWSDTSHWTAWPTCPTKQSSTFAQNTTDETDWKKQWQQSRLADPWYSDKVVEVRR